MAVLWGLARGDPLGHPASLRLVFPAPLVPWGTDIPLAGGGVGQKQALNPIGKALKDLVVVFWSFWESNRAWDLIGRLPQGRDLGRLMTV